MKVFFSSLGNPVTQPVVLWAALVVLFFWPPLSAPAKSDQQTPVITVKKLNQDELTEVVQILKTRYADADAVSDEQISAAAVEGIIRRLSPGVQILDKPPAPADSLKLFKVSLRSELMPDQYGYVYIASVNDQSPQLLDKALSHFPLTMKGLVIDLRFSGGANYQNAADLAARFLGPGQTLFRLKGLKNEELQVFTSSKAVRPNLDTPLVILTNQETWGSAEAFAASLKEKSRALVVGTPSAGQGARFVDIPLSSGRWLRLANARIVFPSGRQIFPRGITPDIVVEMKISDQLAVLENSVENGIADAAIDRETRKRLNEASLVRKENPAIDSFVERNRKLPAANEAKSPRDAMLQRAVDLLKSIRALNLG